MDIGTKDEPGRELTANEVKQTRGGHMEPNVDDTGPEPDPLGIGGGVPAPVDYSATP